MLPSEKALGLPALLTICLPVLLLLSCSLISLQELESVTLPAERDQIIDTDEDPWIEFSEDLDPLSTERLLMITHEGQNVAGATRWEGRRLLFHPDRPLPAGVRYLFRLSGTVYAADGRSFELDIAIPFYAGNADLPVELLSVTPEDAGSCEPGDALVFTFSRAMDQESFDESLSLSPSRELETTWNEEGTTATVAPSESWESAAVYVWSLSADLADTAGVRLGRTLQGSFTVTGDTTAPQVLSCEVALADPEEGFPALTDELGTIKRLDALRITLSEDVAFAEFQDAFSISPAVAGTLIAVAGNVVVFEPADAGGEGFQMDTEYTLTVAAGLPDAAGNTTQAAWSVRFTPDIPALVLESVDGKASDGFPLSSFDESIPTAIDPTPPAEGRYTFTLSFNLPFTSQAEKTGLEEAVRVSSLFPSSVGDPELTAISWLSDLSVSFTYAGFAEVAPNPADTQYYYRLSVAGGRWGAALETGSYLPEEVAILLEVSP